MLNTVVVQRIKNADGSFPTNDTTLPGSYSINGKLRVLLGDGDYSEYDFDDPKIPMVRDFTFNKAFVQLKYEHEVELEKRSKKDNIVVKTTKYFWGEHPLVMVNGQAHKNASPTVQFNMIDLRDESIDNFKKFNSILDAVNKIMSMSTEERRNVAYFYGITPDGLTDGALTLRLADFKTGLCSNEFVAPEFLKVWGAVSNADRDMAVVIKKAVKNGIIINQINDGRNNYYLGSELIGTTENDLISYSKNNVKVYEEFILRQVVEKDVFGEEKAASTSEKKTLTAEQAKNYSAANIIDMRKEAKDLIAGGFINKDLKYWTLGATKLTEVLNEARAKQKESKLETV